MMATLCESDQPTTATDSDDDFLHPWLKTDPEEEDEFVFVPSYYNNQPIPEYSPPHQGYFEEFKIEGWL